ncbi:MAG: TetR/AcrR family transcriptional regulator [Actinomycetota bacterium]|nr:TetR/AcrR family transcriptional regulator [Actinomycetota bacterium]
MNQAPAPRSTATLSPVPGSSAPPHAPGTRSRAGNTMSRTRAAVLTAAAGLLAEQGSRRTSMADIAAAAGIAKGTLYNHFRAKEDVWAAVLTAEIGALADACAGLDLGDALALAARRLGDHPAVRRLAAEEPGALTALLAAPATAPARQLATEVVRRLLADAGRDTRATDLVLRWLESHLARPAPAAATPALLAAMLPSATIVLD